MSDPKDTEQDKSSENSGEGKVKDQSAETQQDNTKEDSSEKSPRKAETKTLGENPTKLIHQSKTIRITAIESSQGLLVTNQLLNGVTTAFIPGGKLVPVSTNLYAIHK